MSPTRSQYFTLRPPDLKPSWKSRGERGIFEILDGISRLVDDGEAVVTIVDAVRARAAIRTTEDLDIDLTATQSFIQWMDERFHVPGADTAWAAIRIAAQGRVFEPEEDPICVRKV